IRAAGDDETARRRPCRPVAVAPYPVPALEIGAEVATTVAVAPEAGRHRGERSRAHQFTRLPDRCRSPVIVEHLHGHAETGSLDLAAPDRCDRIAEDKAGDDVGPAGDTRHLHRSDLAPHPFE